MHQPQMVVHLVLLFQLLLIQALFLRSGLLAELLE